jgi:DNA modification methylase
MPTWDVQHGDCRDIMRSLPPDSVDAIVSDPPYGLAFMGKEWDHGVPGVEFWTEALRVAKPGAHLLAFGGTRMFHRLAVAIEDAGWDIRDCVMWVYGSGFPKSKNVALSIDKGEGHPNRGKAIPTASRYQNASDIHLRSHPVETYEAKSEAAKQWQGWGTALKPAWEPIIVARKPLIGTVAENVLTHGTGALNIDGCRIGETVETWPKTRARPIDPKDLHHDYTGSETRTVETGAVPSGRWPANVIHDGSAEVVGLFPDKAGAYAPVRSGHSGKSKGIYGDYAQRGDDGATFYGDSGSAARFFYCAKTSKAERDAGLEEMPKVRTGGMKATEDGSMLTGSGNERTTIRANTHPTVKPIALMRYLCRLVTPPGGLVLDPFNGSGSTGCAAVVEGFRYLGCELDEHYVAISRARIAHWTTQQAEPDLFG